MVRNLFVQQNVKQTLRAVVGVASEVFTCRAALLVLDAGRVHCGAASEAAAERAGELQLECGEGPALDALRDRRDSVVDDLRVEGRWRFWAPQAAQLGWRSVLSVGVADDTTVAALSLYSSRPLAFKAEDLAAAEVLAQHVGLALSVAAEREHLLRAVETRTLIGQGQGVLMQRYDLDAEQAFKVMRRYSSHSNRKLRQVAEDVIRDRQLPTAARRSVTS